MDKAIIAGAFLFRLEVAVGKLEEFLSPEFILNPKDYNSFSEKGKYLLNVRYDLMDLSLLKDDLNLSYLLVRDLQYHRLKDFSLDFYRVFDYHVEHLYYKIHIIREIMKRLLNSSLRLNLKDKDCVWKNIIIYKSTDNEDIYNNVELNYNNYKPLITSRHYNIHRNKQIFEVDKYEYLFRLQFNLGKQRKEITEELKYLSKELFKDRKDKFVQIIHHIKVQIETHIEKFELLVMKKAIEISDKMN